MPIYAYRCEACGHAKDVLQKISDSVLTECPACGADTFRKQVTAAGFQLKGSGWYVTDFRGGQTSGDASKAEPKSSDTPATDKPESKSESKPESSSDKSPGAAAPAPVASPPPPSSGGSSTGG
jgi:putative FmdB family regulatory protein